VSRTRPTFRMTRFGGLVDSISSRQEDPIVARVAFGRGHIANAAVTMLLVVPAHKRQCPFAGRLKAFEARLWRVQPVLTGAKQHLGGEGVVVTHPRTTIGRLDTQRRPQGAALGNREAQQALALNRKSTGVPQVIQDKPEQPRSILLAGARDDALSREINQLALSMNRLDDPVRRAIEAESRPLAAQIGNEIAQAISRTDKASTVNIRVTSDGKARVDSMTSKGLQVNVDSGLMGAAW
jgi:hypothetical protein